MQRRRGGGGGIRACAAAGLGHNGRMEHANALVIPACEYRRTRWHNGRGWTREILCVPGGSSAPVGLDAAVAGVQAWDLRLSIAEVEAAAAYSSFPGIEREVLGYWEADDTFRASIERRDPGHHRAHQL